MSRISSGSFLLKAALVLGLATAAMLAGATQPARAVVGEGRRVALVIGNAAYRNVVTLANPVFDAKDVSAALKRLGFEVVESYDQTLDGMRGTVGEFAGKLDGAGVALVYYAGHGVSVAGENYLLPVETVLKTEADLDFRTLNVNLVLRQMQRDERVNIVILDACRDNPFKAELARGMKTRSTAVAEGLSEMSAKSAAGTLIAFATDPGMTALDGVQGENSPFAAALLKHMETPSVPISSVLDRVRETVWNATNRKQRPWMNTSIIGEFYLNGAPPAPAPAPEAPPKLASLAPAQVLPAPSPPPPASPAYTLEVRLWESAERSDLPEDYQTYLDSYPQGAFAGLARNRIARASRNLSVAPKTAAVTDEQLRGEIGTAKTEREIAWTPSDRQQALKRLEALGFKPGRIVAEFRPEARQAFAEWQKSRAIAETGYLTKVQRTALWEQSEEEYQKVVAAPAPVMERSLSQPRIRREVVRRAPRAPRTQQAQRQSGPSLGEFGMFLGGVGGLIGGIRR